MFRIRTSLEQRCDNNSLLGLVGTYNEAAPNTIISGSTGSTGPSGSNGSTGPTGTSGGTSNTIEIITQSTGTTMSSSGITIFSGYSASYKTSFLPDASLIGTIKTIEMDIQNSAPVNIITTRGNISLEQPLIKRDLLFTENGWKIQDPVYSSFYLSSVNFISSFTGSRVQDITNFPYFDSFGYVVDMDSSGSTTVVGAPFDQAGDISGNSIGSITILSTGPSGLWSVDTTITPSNYSGTAQQIKFGKAVSISGDGTVIAVGAPGDNFDAGYEKGSVWIYKNDGVTWIEKQKINGTWTAGGTYPAFGTTVDMNYDGSIMCVSGTDTSGGANDTWVFKNDGSDNWIEVENFWVTIGALYGSGSGYKNCRISSSGNTIVNWDGSNIFVYERLNPLVDRWDLTTGTSITTQTVSDPQYNSVDLSSDGNTIVIGIKNPSLVSYVSSGVVCVYTKTGGWNLSFVIPTPFPASSQTESFGASVKLSADGKTLVVGASNVLYPSSEQSAYIYTCVNGQWILKQTILPEPNITSAYFGGSVGISGDGRAVVVGAPGPISFSETGVIGGVFFYK